MFAYTHKINNGPEIFYFLLRHTKCSKGCFLVVKTFNKYDAKILSLILDAIIIVLSWNLMFVCKEAISVMSESIFQDGRVCDQELIAIFAINSR